jgi:hypothetical protein
MADLLTAAQDVAPAPAVSPERRRAMAQDMLLGQHSVSYAAEYTGLPVARVEELARKLHGAKRIPRVRP